MDKISGFFINGSVLSTHLQNRVSWIFFVQIRVKLLGLMMTFKVKSSWVWPVFMIVFQEMEVV